MNRDFHFQNRWVSALTPRLVEGILHRFDCCWIQDQQDYETYLGDVDALTLDGTGLGRASTGVRPQGIPQGQACLHTLLHFLQRPSR